MFYLIANLTAGRGRSKALHSEVQDFFASRSIPVTIFTTEYVGHAKEIAESLPLDATILSLGGDGTLHEIVNACVHTERIIAVIPGGSGDDFAYALGITSTQQALETVLNGTVTKIDCGLAERDSTATYFINSFGIGFDAEVGAKMRQLPKFYKGQVAYLVAVFWQLFSLRNIEMTCWADGKLFFKGASLLTAIQNGKRTGGGFYLTPHASIQDGLFDVVVAGRLGVLETLTILPQTLKEQLVSGPKVHRIRAKEIVVNSTFARLGHFEGEGHLESKTFKATVVEKALNIVLP